MSETRASGPARAVEVRDLRRVYFTGKRRRSRETVTALDGVDLDVEVGEIRGLLGPNGAGKTTLVKILSTVLLPTGGQARVLGYDVVSQAREVRERIGIVFGGERGLYARLTPRATLRYWAALYRLPDAVGARRSEELLDRVGLQQWAERRVETFSRGMKQRLHLARGLIGDPEVVFLDEPTTGLDPVAARDFRALVGELRAEGRTILITTHDMAEAESVCDRVTLIDGGTILGTKSPAAVAEWLGGHERIDVADAPTEVVDRLRSLDGVVSVAERPEGHRVEVRDGEAARVVLRALVDAGAVRVSTSRPALEEVYLRVFGGRGLSV